MSILLRFFITLLLGLNIPFASIQADSGFENDKLNPLNERAIKEVQNYFFQDEEPSLEKINKFKDEVIQRRDETYFQLFSYYQNEKGHDQEKANKKSLENGHYQSFSYLLLKIEELKLYLNKRRFLPLANQILQINYSLKNISLPSDITNIYRSAKTILKSHKIYKNKTTEGEASNLYDFENARFYKHSELEEMKENGVDISLLNPPLNSTLWENHNIEKIKVKDYFQKGQNPLHRGLGIKFCKNKLKLKKIRKVQSKPKMDITCKIDGKKRTFKLKVSNELHSEPSAGALLSALGFSTDISQYRRNIELNIGDITLDEFILDWNTYYSSFDVYKYIKKFVPSEENEGKGNLIIWTEGLLEAKPEELLRFGGWAYGQNGHRGLREARGLRLFNIWISNLDIKESENNKLVLKKEGGRDKLFHIQHDMGFSFGWFFKEKPGNLPWKIIKGNTDKYIHFNYNEFQPNSGFDHVTYADGKWMVRLISRLSRKQIAEAMAVGGWPDAIQKLLTEKLISRRNDLVEAFDLLGEVNEKGEVIEKMEFDQNLTTEDNVVVDGNLIISNIKGYTQDFGQVIKENFNKFSELLKQALLKGVTAGVSLKREWNVDPVEFGFNEGLISNIVFNVNRQVQLNPRPTSQKDQFLVMDTMTIGLRLGAGFIVSGYGIYSKTFTLVYPVEKEIDGLLSRDFFVDLLLPYRALKRQLPENFVLISENSIEGRGRIRVSALSQGVPIGVELDGGRVYLSRSFLGKKQGKNLYYFNDNSQFDEKLARIFIDFGIGRLPFFRYGDQEGSLVRNLYQLDISDIEQNVHKQRAVEALIKDDDPTIIKNIGEQTVIDDDFYQKFLNFNLLGLYRSENIKRKDEFSSIKISSTEEGATVITPEKDYFQLEDFDEGAWSIWDRGELQGSRVVLFSTKTKYHSDIANTSISLSFNIEDKIASNTELSNGYLKFINGVSREENFLKFSPHLHSTGNTWKNLQIFANLILYNDFLEKLLKLQKDEFWRVWSKVSGETQPSELGFFARTNLWTRPYKKAKSFIKNIEKAQQETDSSKKFQYLLDAFRAAIYKDGESFSPVILSTVFKILGYQGAYFNALLTMPIDKEIRLPTRKAIFKEKGENRKEVLPIVNFIFNDAARIYHLF